MPYVQKYQRTELNSSVDEAMKALLRHKNKTFDEGELNYLISSIVWKLFDDNPRYATANKLVGALECVKQEFYRRKIGILEDKKIIENGDI